MSSRLVSAATFCLVLLVSGACGPESSPATEEEAGGTTSGEVKRPLNMEDAVAAGFTKETQTLYSQIAAEDGWQGTFDGIRVQIYVFPEIVPGYVPTSFFTDAVKKEATWQAHRIVRNVGILCGTEGACAKLEKELRVAGGGSPQPKSRVAQSPDQPTGQEDKAASERQMAQPDPGPEAKTVARGADGQPAPAETSGAGAEPASQPVEETPSQPLSEPEPEETRAPVRPTGAALPYSVAIASFTSLEDAMAKQRELAAQDMTVYVAPVKVKGRAYYRLLAGALPDRDAARDLQQSLVRNRVKREATAWDIRPTALAFHMGTYANAGEAGAAIRSLRAQNLPAYTVPGPDQVYVYAGGYEDEADAAVLGERIRDAGLDASLVERVGRVR